MALLRGKVSIGEGAVTWSGKWGFTKESFKEGQVSKFVLKSDAPDAVLKAGRLVGGVDLTFKGFFIMNKEDSKEKIKEKFVKLRFTAGDDGSSLAMNGTGENKFGEFTLSGTYKGETAQMTGNKAYKGGGGGGSDDEYSSDDDDGEGFDDLAAEELKELQVLLLLALF